MKKIYSLALTTMLLGFSGCSNSDNSSAGDSELTDEELTSKYDEYKIPEFDSIDEREMWQAETMKKIQIDINEAITLRSNLCSDVLITPNDSKESVAKKYETRKEDLTKCLEDRTHLNDLDAAITKKCQLADLKCNAPTDEVKNERPLYVGVNSFLITNFPDYTYTSKDPSGTSARYEEYERVLINASEELESVKAEYNKEHAQE